MTADYAYLPVRVEQYAPLSKSLRVLDICSRPGNLEDAWHDCIGEIHGLDICKRYNEITRVTTLHIG